MSGDTLTGRALQFTNDNKQVYGYSGRLSVSNSEVIAFEFPTPNDSYIEAAIQLLWTTTTNEYTGDDCLIHVSFNNNVVSGILTSSAHKNASELLKITFPPSVNAKVTIKNAAASTTHYGYVSLTGKVGMAPRVGNLVE